MASSKTVRPYKWIAQYCDQFMTFQRPIFAKARQQILGPVLPGVESVCDLCCGTGGTAIEFAKAGYKACGVDLSATMIRIAKEKAANASLAVRFTRADMLKFTLPQPVDLITCEFDALNHVPNKSDLKLVSQSVAKALRPGGYFYFDVNNLPAFENVWPLTWFQETPEVAVVFHGGHNKGEDRAWTGLEWFIKEGPLWRRHHEYVEEVCWTRREIRDALRAAGMKIIGTFDATLFFQNDHLTRPGYRTFYLARYNRTI
jgi:SAM-dependent methyltransferase